MLLFLALWWSDDGGDSRFPGSGSPEEDNSRQSTFTDGIDRQTTWLHVSLGDAGSISVQPRRRDDVVLVSSPPVLEVLPDSRDAECVVQLRACRSCWIGLTAVVVRSAEPEVAGMDDQRSTTTGNNDSKSNVVACQLWFV